MNILLKNIISDRRITVEENLLPIRKFWKRDNLSSIKLEKRSVTIRTHGRPKRVVRNTLMGYFERHGWVILVPEWKYNRDISQERFVIRDGFLYFKLENEIGIWYMSGDGHVRFFILPVSVKFNRDLLELVGILDGEMTEKKSPSGGTTLRITNADSTVLQKVVKAFRCFGIKSRNWKVSITLNSKGQKVSKRESKKAIAYWSKCLQIPLENFGKTTVTKKYRSKFSKYGVVQLRYSNQLFWHFVTQFIHFSQNIILKNKSYCKHYLRGLLAGEGGIGLKQDGKLRFIQIGVTKDHHRQFYLQVLTNLGLKNFKTYKERIEIYTLKNFELFERWNAFGLIPYRDIRFHESLNKSKKFFDIPIPSHNLQE